MHSEKSAILSRRWVCAFPTWARSNRQGQELSPTHASLRSATADHDYYFELLLMEQQNAQSITRCSTAHHGDVRAVLRANRT